MKIVRYLAIDLAVQMMLDLIEDPWDFMEARKKFSPAPIIVVMMLLGVLIVVTQSSAIAPFIYTLF